MERPLDRALDLAVLAIAVAIAFVAFRGYYEHSEDLWRNFYHDRNSHYAFGLDMALKLRNLDLVGFLERLESAKVWPPLHGLILSITLLVGGIDHRLGVLPSLAGWVMTIVFSFAIARRALCDRTAGLMAGAIAVAFIIASPSLRLISTDVMLEGLGSGLSAMALWAFVRAWQGPGRVWDWRILALTLTALFFHKGNYWGLATASIAATALMRRPEPLGFVGRWVGRIAGMALGLARGLPRDPVLILLVLVLALMGAIGLFGPFEVTLFGRNLVIANSGNLLTLPYAIAYWRAAIAWRRHRAAFHAEPGAAGRAGYYCPAVPVMISFLLRGRLATFLWFVGPENNPGSMSVGDGAMLYLRAFLDGFNAAPWVGIAALGFFGIGLVVGWRSIAPASRVVFAFAILATIAVLAHPQHQGRFLSTIVFAIFLGAGIGAAFLFTRATEFLAAWLRPAAAVLAVGLVAIALSVVRPDMTAASLVAIRPIAGQSDIARAATYAPYADGYPAIGLLATTGNSRALDWPLREWCRCDLRIYYLLLSPKDREEAFRVTEAWLRATPARRVILLDLPDSPDSIAGVGWTWDRMRGMVDAATKGRTGFSLTTVGPIPQFGGRILVLDRNR
ncbi:MAG: hypothetical protein J0H63_11965 [Rhizobiales bacterium]|nr:hypothetical protein [Hyphomicrobiales bacterium]